MDCSSKSSGLPKGNGQSVLGTTAWDVGPCTVLDMGHHVSYQRDMAVRDQYTRLLFNRLDLRI